MTHDFTRSRLLAAIILLSLLLWPAPAAPAAAQALPAPVLARVDLPAPADGLASLPVYAYLRDARGLTYALVLAPEADLAAAGLPYTVLDPAARDAHYLLVSDRRAASGVRPRAAAPSFAGRVLHDDGYRWLLRADPAAAAPLAALGFELEWLGESPLAPPAPLPRLAGAAVPDPEVAAMIAEVQTAALLDDVAGLSGVHPVTVGGQPFTFTTRQTDSGPPIQKATQYVYERLSALGLSMSYQGWTSLPYAGRNVVGERLGLTLPEEIVLVTAHLDDYANVPTAPGADDNASGAAAVLAAAGIMARYRFARTVRFLLFTGEEQGLRGSAAYAAQAAQAGENVVAVFNMDMLAWDNAAGPDAEIHTRLPADPGYAADQQIAGLFVQAVNGYGLGALLLPHVLADGEGASDHASFWRQGYPAVLAIEDTRNDINPYYHSVGDTLDRLNPTYYTSLVRASLATVAHLAGVMPRSPALQIGKDAAPAPAHAGERLAYTLRITNTGGTATGVVARDRLPAQTLFDSAADGGALQGGEVVWPARSILPNSQISLAYTVTVACAADGGHVLNDDYRLTADGLTSPVQGSPVSIPAGRVDPRPGFTYPQPALLRRPVAFHNTSRDAVAYQWDFGDGTGSGSADPGHLYAATGVYTVTLTAANACATATLSQAVRVEEIAVALSPAAPGSGAPLDGVVYELELRNASTIPESYAIELASDAWHTAAAPAVAGPLAPGERRTLPVTVTVPPATPAGAQDHTLVTARALHDPRTPAAQATAGLVTTAEAGYAALVVPPRSQRYAAPGTTVTYTVQAANAGNLPDTYDLAVSGALWPTRPAVATVGPLSPGIVRDLDVAVTVPPEAPLGQVDAAELRLASRGAPVRVVTATLATEARIVRGVALWPPTMSGRAVPGGHITYSLRITNTGNLTDTFSLEPGPSAWPVAVRPAAVTLPTSAAAPVELVVDVPAAPVSRSEAATLTAASQSAPEIRSQARALTTWWRWLWLPVIFNP